MLLPFLDSPDTEAKVTSEFKLLEDVEEKLELLQQEINNNPGSWQNPKRESKKMYLEQLKIKYESHQLSEGTIQQLSEQQEYKGKVFSSLRTSEVRWFAARFSQACKKTENLKAEVKQTYNIDKNLVQELQAHVTKLHYQFNQDRHALLADRCWQKYTALRKITRLYEAQQLTPKHIIVLEEEFNKLYDGFFSMETYQLIDRVRNAITSDEDESSTEEETSTIFPFCHKI